MGKIVRSALPTAEWETSGAYFSIHNCLAELPKVTSVQSGVFAIPCGRKVDLFWQMFTVDYRDDDDKDTTRGAAQPADSICKKPMLGLSVGILHITIPSKGSSPSMGTRREIVERALDFLAGLHSQEWDMQLPIGRLLVGDFNMTKDEAEAATQDAQQPARCAPFHSFHGLSRWQLHATENGRSGDLFAAMGCTIETMLVPIGASFKERSMRNNHHDAVAATLWIPYDFVPDAEPPRSPSEPRDSDRHGDDAQASASPAAASSKGGAAQPANLKDGATQPVPASPTASSSSSQELPDWSPDVQTDEFETAAETLHQNLMTLEENEEDPRVMAELGRLLFQKKLQEVDGRKVQHVASTEETRLAITKLLRRRQDFLLQHNITFDNYVLTDEQRRDIFNIWKDEYHGTALQQELQMRDSWKEPEKSKGKGKGSTTQRTGKSAGGATQPPGKSEGRATQPAVKRKFFATGGKTKTVKEATLPPSLGPNKDAVRKGKHSRFARHLQRMAGSKLLAELILFTGCVKANFLRQAFCGGPHPAEENRDEAERKRLKINAAEAKLKFRNARSMESKVQRGVLVQKRPHARGAAPLLRPSQLHISSEPQRNCCCVQPRDAPNARPEHSHRSFHRRPHARVAQQMAALQHRQVDACRAWMATWPRLIVISSFGLSAALLFSTLRRFALVLTNSLFSILLLCRRCCSACL